MAGKKTASRQGTVTELPDGPPDATGLTPRQQRVLSVIKDSIEPRAPSRSSTRAPPPRPSRTRAPSPRWPT